MSKYYVVWKGRKPGIYTSWEQCKEQVHKFSGAKFESFDSSEEAKIAFKNPNYSKQQAIFKPTSIIEEMQILLERVVTELQIYRPKR